MNSSSERFPNFGYKLSEKLEIFLSVSFVFEYNLSDAGKMAETNATEIVTTEVATTEIATKMQNMTTSYEPEGNY